MKKLFLIIVLLINVLTISAQGEDSVISVRDNSRYELIRLSYGAYVYSIKFDTWTGNLGVISKDGVSYALRDLESEKDAQNKESIFEITQTVEAIANCYILNKKTGELWEAIFKGGKTCTIKKL